LKATSKNTAKHSTFFSCPTTGATSKRCGAGNCLFRGRLSASTGEETLEKNKTPNSDTGGATGSQPQSVPQTKVFFYKTLVNMQIIREGPPFFATYYLRGHRKPQVGDKLYIKTPWGYESANMVVAGFSRGAVCPAPAGE